MSFRIAIAYGLAIGLLLFAIGCGKSNPVAPLFSARGSADGGMISPTPSPTATAPVSFTPTPTPVPYLARIMFASNQDGFPNSLYSMDENGGSLRLLARNVDLYGPRNHPGGKYVVFYRQNSQIGLIKTDGTGLRILSGVSGRAPVWSWDGTKIAVHSVQGSANGLDQIAVFRPDGGGFTVLTDGPYHNIMPVWTRDGRIVYARCETSFIDGPRSIMVMNADGTGKRALTGAYECAYPTSVLWDHSILANRRVAGNDQIWVMNGYTGVWRQLTFGAGYSDGAAHYSADGTRIVFQSNRDDGWTPEIYIMNADGTNQRNLTNSPAYDEGGVYIY